MLEGSGEGNKILGKINFYFFGCFGYCKNKLVNNLVKGDLVFSIILCWEFREDRRVYNIGWN